MNIKTVLLLGSLLISGVAASAPSTDDAKTYNLQLTIDHGNAATSKFTLNVLNGLVSSGSNINSGHSDASSSSGVIYTVKPVMQKNKGTLEVKLNDSINESASSDTHHVEIQTFYFSKTIPVTLGKTTTENIGFIHANGKNNPVTLTVLISETN